MHSNLETLGKALLSLEAPKAAKYNPEACFFFFFCMAFALRSPNRISAPSELPKFLDFVPKNPNAKGLYRDYSEQSIY